MQIAMFLWMPLKDVCLFAPPCQLHALLCTPLAQVIQTLLSVIQEINNYSLPKTVDSDSFNGYCYHPQIESRWSPYIFQASSFQLLKLKNLLRWSLFTFIYNRITNMNFIYMFHTLKSHGTWSQMSFFTFILTSKNYYHLTLSKGI